MDEWAERCQGAKPEIDPEFRAQKHLIAELTSIRHGSGGHFGARSAKTPHRSTGGVPDPAAVEGRQEHVERAFFEAFTILDRRITLFLCLPLATLEEEVIQARLIASDDGRRGPREVLGTISNRIVPASCDKNQPESANRSVGDLLS